MKPLEFRYTIDDHRRDVYNQNMIVPMRIGTLIFRKGRDPQFHMAADVTNLTLSEMRQIVEYSEKATKHV